jgi:hypothetical protein
MAFIATVLMPAWSEQGEEVAPSGRRFDYEPEDQQAFLSLPEVRLHVLNIRRGVATTWLSEKGGRSGPDPETGAVIEVDHWGVMQAIEWMVQNGYDPATQDFIPTFNNPGGNARQRRRNRSSSRATASGRTTTTSGALSRRLTEPTAIRCMA